jgi:hypothetical protein
MSTWFETDQGLVNADHVIRIRKIQGKDFCRVVLTLTQIAEDEDGVRSNAELGIPFPDRASRDQAYNEMIELLRKSTTRITIVGKAHG